MNRWGPDSAANWEPASELHNGDDRGLTLHWARNYTHEVSDSFQQPVVILQMKKQRPEGLNILAGVSLPESAGVSSNAKGKRGVSHNTPLLPTARDFPSHPQESRSPFHSCPLPYGVTPAVSGLDRMLPPRGLCPPHRRAEAASAFSSVALHCLGRYRTQQMLRKDLLSEQMKQEV